MERPPARLKSSANRLAELLSSEDGLRILHVLSEFDTSNHSAPAGSEPSRPDGHHSTTGRVGIWEPKLKDGELCFTRARDSEPWGLWAQIGTIRIRPEAKRVVLIGESVARGLFYDPHYTPASALQQILRFASGADDIDVIDLARTGMQFKDLVELTEPTLTLKPDVIVVLAGNNWHSLVGLNPENSREVSDMLRRDGTWSEVSAYIEEKLQIRVKEYLAQLAAVAQASQVKVAIIVPEFNLCDWREHGNPAPLLDAGENQRWIALREQARKALAGGDLESCRNFAGELLKIDQGTSSTGFSLLAQVALRRGEPVEAKDRLENSRDAGAFLPRTGSPRCYAWIQETFRTEALRHGLTLIDLPKLFEEHLAGAIPGRELFHDYCHFTEEGIRLAMSATAVAVLPLLGNQARSWHELSNCTTPLRPEIVAEANLLAAFHNANWSQGFEIIYHHLLRGLHYSPAVAEAMYLYADFHIRRAPVPLCESFQRMSENLSLSAMTLFYVPPRTRKPLNLEAVKAIRQALEVNYPERSVALYELLKAEHGVIARPVDLLERAYCSPTYEKLEGDWPQKAAYFRAYDNASLFTLICERACAVQLKVTHRIARATSPGCVQVRVNGTAVVNLAATEEWQTEIVTIPAETLNEGANQIALEWPSPQWVKADKVAQIADGLEQSDFLGVYPVFGELHTLRATAVCNAN